MFFNLKCNVGAINCVRCVHCPAYRGSYVGVDDIDLHTSKRRSRLKPPSTGPIQIFIVSDTFIVKGQSS